MIGQDLISGHLKIHVFRESVSVINTENAGRRGLTCPRLSASVWPDAKIFEMIYNLGLRVDEIKTWADAVRFAELAKAKLEATVYREELKSVRVAPASFKPIELGNDSMWLRVDYESFTVSDLTDQNNMPRLIDTSDFPKSGYAKLRKWAANHAEEIKRMKFGDVWETMRSMGLYPHYYYAMD